MARRVEPPRIGHVLEHHLRRRHGGRWQRAAQGGWTPVHLLAAQGQQGSTEAHLAGVHARVPKAQLEQLHRAHGPGLHVAVPGAADHQQLQRQARPAPRAPQGGQCGARR